MELNVKTFNFLLLQVCFLVASSNTRGQSIVVRLELLERNRSGRVYVPGGIRFLEKLRNPPGGKWKLPELKSGNPVFSRLQLAGKTYLMVLDTDERDLDFYNILYFDSNGNGDLTDDKPYKGPLPTRKGGTMFFQRFTRVNADLVFGGKRFTYTFSVYANAYNVHADGGGIKWEDMEKRMRFYMITRCALGGEFSIGKKKFKVMLADMNADGVFGNKLDKSSKDKRTGPRRLADKIFLTTGKNFTFYDGIDAGGILSIGNKLLVPETLQWEKLLVFRPFRGKTGKIRIPMDVERLTLRGKKPARDVTVFRPGKEADLPSGSYTLGSYSATKTDDGDNPWVLTAETRDRNTGAIRVNPGETASLAFGPPYFAQVTVDARKIGKDPNKLYIAYLSFALIGKAGERVVDLRCLSYNQSGIPRSRSRKYRPREPVVIIKNAETGKTVYERAFHYG